ncbi:MAG: hypothetical protein V4582_20470 [Pseudomonadota bacterium]
MDIERAILRIAHVNAQLTMARIHPPRQNAMHERLRAYGEANEQAN